MPRSKKFPAARRLAALGVCAFGFLLLRADVEDRSASGAGQSPLASLEEAWNLAARIDFQGAYDRFRELEESGAVPEREARLGRAVVLLNLPPRTTAQIDRAEAMLAEIAAADPDDDVGLMARLYHARAPHFHRQETRPEEAFARYEALADDRPEHFVGQYARMQCALIDLTSNDYSAPGAIDARAAYWAERAAHVTHPALRRNLDFTLSVELIANGGSLERAQRHSVASVENEPTRFDLLGNWRMRSIVLAVMNGDDAKARELLEDFLSDYPGEWRLFAERLLAAVEKRAGERP